MTTFSIYCGLFAATTFYAVLLAWLKHLWEPDLTWLEVIVGTMLCLVAPYLDQRYNGPLTSELYEQRVWLAFFVGGLPIVSWQLGRSIRARIQFERRIRGSHGTTWHTPDRATSLADEPGGPPEAND